MITTAIIAKNEANRYLTRVLERCWAFSDTIILLDDQSDDDTAIVAQKADCAVRRRSGDPMWGAETPARAELWDWAAEVAGDGWVLFCDADQYLVGDPRPYCRSWEVNSWAFPLYDCWDAEDQFRADGFWQGYAVPRVWLVKPSAVPDGWKPEWSGRGLHSGHIPANYNCHSGIATDLYWLHLGYVRREDREKKHAKYLSQAHQLSDYERNHAETILD